jgi:hypothetical protein
MKEEEMEKSKEMVLIPQSFDETKNRRKSVVVFLLPDSAPSSFRFGWSFWDLGLGGSCLWFGARGQRYGDSLDRIDWYWGACKLLSSSVLYLFLSREKDGDIVECHGGVEQNLAAFEIAVLCNRTRQQSWVLYDAVGGSQLVVEIL